MKGGRCSFQWFAALRAKAQALVPAQWPPKISRRGPRRPIRPVQEVREVLEASALRQDFPLSLLLITSSVARAVVIIAVSRFTTSRLRSVILPEQCLFAVPERLAYPSLVSPTLAYPRYRPDLRAALLPRRTPASLDPTDRRRSRRFVSVPSLLPRQITPICHGDHEPL